MMEATKNKLTGGWTTRKCRREVGSDRAAYVAAGLDTKGRLGALIGNLNLEKRGLQEIPRSVKSQLLHHTHTPSPWRNEKKGVL